MFSPSANNKETQNLWNRLPPIHSGSVCWFCKRENPLPSHSTKYSTNKDEPADRMTCWEIAFRITAPPADSSPTLLFSFINFSGLKISPLTLTNFSSNLLRNPDLAQKHQNPPNANTTQQRACRVTCSCGGVQLAWKHTCMPARLFTGLFVTRCLGVVSRTSPSLDTQLLKRCLKYLTVRQRSTIQQPWDQFRTAKRSTLRRTALSGHVGQISWRKERSVEGREEERKDEDKWGSRRINEGWSRGVWVTSVLTFLTMCCLYCTQQHTISPLWNVTLVREIQEGRERNGGEGDEARRGKATDHCSKGIPCLSKGGLPLWKASPLNSPSLPTSTTDLHRLLKFPFLLLHQISSALRFNLVIICMSAPSPIDNHKKITPLYKMHKNPLPLHLRKRKKIVAAEKLETKRNDDCALQRGSIPFLYSTMGHYAAGWQS